MAPLKNALIGFGGFYLALWLRWPLILLWNLVTNHLTFRSGLQTMLLMPAVYALPTAIVAFAVGAVMAHTVEARFPSRWALIPAALFLQENLFVHRTWYVGPTTADYVTIAVEAAIPALACIAGAAIVDRRRQRAAIAQSSISD